MKMEQNKDWVKKYFRDQEIDTMGELGRQSYSPEALQKLAAGRRRDAYPAIVPTTPHNV
jgi:hypothetical protein